MLLSKTKIRNWAFLAGFFSLLFYDFHRYIFKYNSEGTSPTYTNTPMLWKVGKYLLMTIIMAVFFSCLTYVKRVSKWFIFVYGIILFILVVNVVNFVVYGELNTDEIEYCLWFFVIIPYWFATDSVFNIEINYRKIITWSAVILFLSNGIAVGNYYLTGRLPALGYEGGLVRFGGFWDDPNGFGIVCVFYFYYFITNKKYLLSLIALASIVLTFSFTAYFLLIASIGYWVFSNYRIINKKWAIIGAIIISSIIFIGLYFFDLIMSLYEVKSESVTEHLTKNMVFSIIPLQNSFYNYFPVSILIHGAFLLLFISLFKTSDNKDLKFYFFLFITSSFFFSMLYTFPLNLIFIFLLVDYLKRRTPLTVMQSL